MRFKIAMSMYDGAYRDLEWSAHDALDSQSRVPWSLVSGGVTKRVQLVEVADYVQERIQEVAEPGELMRRYERSL